MARIEVINHTEPHTEGGCGGQIEIRVDRNKKRVTSVCLKCRIGSIVEHGKVVSEGIKIPEN